MNSAAIINGTLSGPLMLSAQFNQNAFANSQGEGLAAIYSSPDGSDTVGLPRFCDALRSSLVIVHRTPSVVLHAAFAAVGLLPPSPSHVTQSAGSKNAGIRSDTACSVVSD